MLFFGFAVIWTGVTAFGIYREYREISVAMTEHKLDLIEGRVSDFTPMPYTGHTMVRFCVRNVYFAYSDYVHTFGFHNTVSHGGPIRDGLGVRIAYVGNVIVRLDVATTRPIHPGATRSDTRIGAETRRRAANCAHLRAVFKPHCDGVEILDIVIKIQFVGD